MWKFYIYQTLFAFLSVLYPLLTFINLFLPMVILILGAINVSWFVNLPSSVRHAVEIGLGKRYVGVAIAGLLGSVLWIITFLLMFCNDSVASRVEYTPWILALTGLTYMPIDGNLDQPQPTFHRTIPSSDPEKDGADERRDPQLEQMKETDLGIGTIGALPQLAETAEMEEEFAAIAQTE
ncbi:hypothetical protein CPB84DRAFT_1823839 [Gymnopilus junonius]|uniref:Uncharacterized protein n=1 Tax=Gymnopilus junonius TaxID=109634 RepID=A0A9P5NTY7_GYMJU|nr:hypothetical protein CPB84DRAFT_1823839 [Gymnopilus junonius]